MAERNLSNSSKLTEATETTELITIAATAMQQATIQLLNSTDVPPEASARDFAFSFLLQVSGFKAADLAGIIYHMVQAESAELPPGAPKRRRGTRKKRETKTRSRK